MGIFTTQQYAITGGNVDDAFDVKFRRQPITGVLELDLIVNGNLGPNGNLVHKNVVMELKIETGQF